MNVKELLTQPLAVAAAAGATLLQLLGVTWIDPVATVLMANIGTVFSALSISSSVLAPEIPWLPEETLTTLALVAGGIYVLTLVDRVIDQIRERMDNDTD